MLGHHETLGALAKAHHREMLKASDIRRALREAGMARPRLQDRVLANIGRFMIAVGKKLQGQYPVMPHGSELISPAPRPALTPLEDSGHFQRENDHGKCLATLRSKPTGCNSPQGQKSALCPEPITPRHFFKRTPCANPKAFKQPMDKAVGRSWLEVAGEGQHELTGRGKEGGTGKIGRSYQTA